MSYRRVPRNPAWCSGCIAPEAYDGKTPCSFHRGPNGETVEYTGDDSYDPAPDSRVRTEIVGKRFWGGGYDFDNRPVTRIYEVFGYDPRNGFWVRTVDNDEGPARQTNISERAIGGTFHRVQMTSGAWHLLEMIVQLGRLPTPEEAAESEHKPTIDLAFTTLRRNGLVAKDAQITARGLALFPQREALYWHIYLD